MKTIGETLRSARLERKLDYDQLSALTRIDERYIHALEENNFKKLPASTFTKGFVRNLALALGKNPDDMLALLRRDYQTAQPVGKPLPFRHHRRFSFASIFQSQVVLLISGGVVFLVYLVFQYRAVITPPPLLIASPVVDAVIISPVVIDGRSASGTTVTVDDDLKITTDQEGRFQARLNLDTGRHEVKIAATNRFGRTTTKTIPITIISQ